MLDPPMRNHSAIMTCMSNHRRGALLSLLIGWILLLSGNALGACEPGGLGAVCFDTDYDPSIRNPVKANDLMTESLQTSVGEHGMAFMHYKGSLMFVDRDGVWSYRGGLGRVKWGDYGTIFSGGAARIACGAFSRYRWRPDMIQLRCSNAAGPKADSEVQVTPINPDTFLLKFRYKCTDTSGCSAAGRQVWIQTKPNTGAVITYESNAGGHSGFRIHVDETSDKYDQSLNMDFYLLSSVPVSANNPADGKLFWSLAANEEKTFYVVFTTQNRLAEVPSYLSNPESYIQAATADVEAFLNMFKYPSNARTNWEKQRYYYSLWNYWYNLLHRWDGRESYWGDATVIKPGGMYNGIWIWDSFFAAWGMAAACKPDRQECFGLSRSWVEVFFRNKYSDGQWPREVRDRKRNQGWQAPGGWAFAMMQMHKVNPSRTALCNAYTELKSYHDWVRDQADQDNDNLFEWGGTNSGWDGSARWDPSGMEEAVDLQTWMILDAESLGEMAAICAPGDAATWTSRLASYKQAAQRLWVGDWFYDLARSSNAPAADANGPTKSAAAYMLMMADATGSAQETKLADELRNAQTFGPVNGIGVLPTISRSDHAFSPDGSDTWSGANWMNINLVAWLGFKRQGRTADADYLKDLTLKQLQMGQIGYESYNSNTGGKATGGFGNWPYVWSDVAYIAMILDWSPFSVSQAPDLPPEPLGTPTLSAPANGATVTGDRATFRYGATGALEYRLLLNTNANPTAEVFRGTQTQWTSQALTPGTYYWKVIASAGSLTASSPVWRFTLQAAATPPPPPPPPPPPSGTGTFETGSYYITDQINSFNNGAFDTYLGGGWMLSSTEPGPTLGQFKRLIDQSRPHPVYLSVHSFIADEAESCLYLKYEPEKLDTRLSTYLYPRLDALYADATYKTQVRGLVNGDELPIKFKMTGAAIRKYAAQFQSRFGYPLNLSQVADSRNYRARQDAYTFVSEGCRDGLNNAYARLRSRYPDWPVYYTPHFEYTLSWYYDAGNDLRFSTIEPVGLNFDGILVEGLYRYSESAYYTNKVYDYVRLAKAVAGNKPVCALLQNFWPAASDTGIKNTWPEYIKYQAVQAYVAGADCIMWWSNDHFESNSPVYLSSVGGDRWAATVEVSRNLTNRAVFHPLNRIALVWGSYQVGANQNPGGISPLKNLLVIGNLLTQWGVPFDAVLTKQIEADPGVLDSYGGLIVAGVDFEPQAAVTAVQRASAVKLYDDGTFKRGRLGEAVTFQPAATDIKVTGSLASSAQSVTTASTSLRAPITAFLAAAGVPETAYNIQDSQWASQARTFDGLWTLNGQGGYAFTSLTTSAPCVPDWSCTTWTSCQNNRTSRSCTDLSRCGTSQGKPAEYADCAEEEGVVDLFPVDQPPAPSAPSEPAPEGGQAQGGGGGGGGGLARTSPQTQALPPVEKSSGGSSVTLLFRKPTSTGPAASIQEAIGLETNVMRSPANLDILSIIFVALVLSVALVVFIVHQERVHVPAFAREIHIPFLTEAARLTQLERILPGPGSIFNHGGYMNERIDPPPFLPRADRVLPDIKEDLPLREILALLDERHKAERPSLEK